MHYLKTSFIVVISYSIFVFGETSQKYVFFLGGGGEPPGDRTMFDTSTKQAGIFFKTSGWQVVKSLYNGGHPQSEKDIKENLDSKAESFTKENFQKTLDQLAKSTYKFHKDDEFLIVVNTHGSPQIKSEYTHSVSAADGTISLDDIQKLQRVLEQKGIKVGILDASCFSGNSQKLASKNTCVISVATSGSVGNISTISNFFKNSNRGASLEEVFLQMRKNDLSIAFPEISTSTGAKVASSLADLRSVSPAFNRLNNAPDFTKQGDINNCTVKSEVSCPRNPRTKWVEV